MAFELDSLFIDPEIGEKGVWVDFYGDSKLKLASIESAKYKSLLAKLARQNRLKMAEENDESNAVMADVTCEALARCVLLDWKGIGIAGQADVPYTWQMGKDALLKSQKFREFVSDRAADTTIFKKELVEEVKKPLSGS
jgi:hypothetical protein